MEANHGNLVTSIKKCAIGADVNKNLQYVLKLNMNAPDTNIIRQTMNDSILSGVETYNKKYFEFAESLAKLLYLISPLEGDNRLELWNKITTGNITAILTAEDKNGWSWEKYFDFDIKRRKKLDAEQRHEAMKALYKAKLLSIFRAKHYPKVFFTLLKLGADPFEMKKAKLNPHSITLTMAIVKSKKLSVVKRLHLLEHLSKKNLLRADPCGQYVVSPVIICLRDQTRNHALKYVIGAAGVEKLSFDGKNILQVLSDRNKIDLIMPCLSVEQFKVLLVKTDSSITDNSIKLSNNYSRRENLLMAVKELLLENKELSVSCRDSFPSEFVAQHDQKNWEYLIETKTDYWKNVEPQTKSPDLRFDGNTEFNFEHLPVELAEMIYVYLPARDRAHLNSVNRTMKKLPESFGEYFWKKTLRTDFPTVHSRFQNDTADRTWYERTESVARSIENMRNSRFSTKILKLKEKQAKSIESLYFDENWLCIANDSKLMFWNCQNDREDQIRCYGMPFGPLHLSFLNSPSDEIPNFVASSGRSFYYDVNNHKKTFLRWELGESPTGGSFVEPLSPTKVLIANGIFDIELDKIIVPAPVEGIDRAKKHIVGENILGGALQSRSIVVYDKDMKKLAQSEVFGNSFDAINIIDENLFYGSTIGNVTAVFDIRTMKVLHRYQRHLPGTNGAYRTISADRGVGIVRNLKNNTWENTFVLPNGIIGQPILNSHYAVFASDLDPVYSSMIVLDFDSITK